MAEVWWVCLSYASSYAGFALLALRQRPHYSAVTGEKSRGPLPKPLLRQNLAFGSTLLGASFVCCLLAQGPSFGSILWVLLLGAGAVSVLFTLTYRPRWLRPASHRLGSAPDRGESDRRAGYPSRG
jgi:hypothetical protein